MDERHSRKLNRLHNFDYSMSGYYFVTLCIRNKIELFGEILDGEMILNHFGEMAKKCWQEIPSHFPHCQLDEFVIMPDHIHGIIIIENDDPVGNNNHCSHGNNHCSHGTDSDYNNHSRFAIANIRSRNNDHCSQRDPQKEIPWQTQLSRSLSSIIRGYKIGVTKYFRAQHNDIFQWQKSFHDHIIRDEKALNNIRQYIQDNPKNWNI